MLKICIPLEGVRFGGPRYGKYIIIDTDEKPVEGDRVLTKRNGWWAVVPWDGETEGFVVHGWSSVDLASYTPDIRSLTDTSAMRH